MSLSCTSASLGIVLAAFTSSKTAAALSTGMLKPIAHSITSPAHVTSALLTFVRSGAGAALLTGAWLEESPPPPQATRRSSSATAATARTTIVPLFPAGGGNESASSAR
jgi:hypothetical protein